jgi:outer membrane protein OmpA-like peptidoglycan-associated protein
MTRKVHVGILKAVCAATLFATVAASPTPARAEFDIGIFAGFRGFGEEAGILVLDDRFLFGARLGVLFGGFGIEAEGSFIPTHLRNGGTSVTELGVRGHLRYVFNHTGFARPFLLAGFGAALRSGDGADTLPDPPGKTAPEGHLGAGFELYFTDTFGVRVDGRAYWPTKEDFAFDTFNWEVMFGFQIALGKPKGAPAAPPPSADADNDGVPDDQDKCPTEAGPPPTGCPVKDTDNDGVPDDQDKCPTEPGPADRGGCPIKDTDNDGVPDDQDKCPTEPGPADRQGCPPKDTDGDGILDENDKCPDQPETKNGFEDEDGCPDEVPAAVKKFTGVIKGVNFATGKATLTKGSYKTLDQVVKVLQDYPSVKLEISGHTDDTGKHDKNVQLSQDRAESVKAYLVSKGIDESRLKAAGYGPDKPLIPGKSARARAANRRVEFNLITQ